MRIKKWGIILGMTMLLWMAFPFLGYVHAISDNGLYFSASQHFYDKDVNLRLWAKPGAKIYYTLNGETPSRESLSYQKPIQFPLPEQGIHVVTIRAIAYYEDNTSTSEYIHTYFIGKNIFERYHSLIMVLTTDPSNLYDYETGILVGGRLRDEWKKENPDKEIKYSRPANYNLRGIESERNAYLEIFDPAGQKILAQNVGIRVHGAGSRAAEQKSFKIFARSEYGENTLNYNFFPDCPEYQDDKLNYTYKRLVMRNNSSIQNTAMIEMLQKMETADVQECRPCCGYLNGSYYQSGWLMEVFDKNYFNSNYGTTEEEGYWGVVADYNEAVLDGIDVQENSSDEPEQPYLDKEYYDLFQRQNFQDDFIFDEFCKVMDVENMLWYFAAEVYMGNMDWPYNNVKMYRWYSYNNNYTEGTVKDGRWRFLFYDFDYGFSADYNARLLAHVLNQENTEGRYHQIFAKLMQRDDMKKRFKEIMQELSETVFEPDNACRIIEETYAISQTELLSSLEEEGADAAEIEKKLHELEEMKKTMLEFAQKRPKEIKKQLEELL